MQLSAGTRLGPYEILAPLGAGGMGEVYRARDTRLGREVAVKVLPQHLSASAEVRTRFEREAKTVSSLNHPHICVLHDVGREGDTDFLVMELVDGETLASRLARGALPTAEVVKLGVQVADALERAHRAGIIHRDLKPGNIMLTKSGAKLMDFGLARATGMAGDAGSGVTIASLTQSPTVGHPLTAEGTIVGTFQYMSPEQLEGKDADARSDMWALGCVIYEMASGQRAFDGKSQASLIAGIMHSEPRPVRELVPASPPDLERLIRECLAKDPEDRRQSAGDLRRELNRIARGEVAGTPSQRSRAARYGIGVAMIVAGLAALGGYFAGQRRATTSTPSQVAFTIPAPPGSRFRFTIEEDGTRLAPPVISPDGRQVVFGVVDAQGARILVRRALDDITVHPIAGTTDGRMPFWSPDGRTLGFFAEGKLRKVSVSGGAPVTLAGGAVNSRGASWNRRGTIVYAPNANSALFSVSENGGTPVQVTFPDTTLPDISHRWPVFLPDGEHFLFLVWTNNGAVRDSMGGIYVGSTRSREVKRVDSAPSNAVYGGGSLVFARDGLLFRAPFDETHATLGTVTPTNQPVDWDASTGLALFDVSPNGTLLCRETRLLVPTTLVWFNRVGAPLDTVSAAADFRQVSVARHGQSAAASIGNATGENDIWLLDFARGLTSRYTKNAADEQDPMISTDGRDVAYSSDVDGPYHVFLGTADQSRTVEKISPPAADWNLLDWSADQQFMLLATSTHLWVLDVETRHGERWHTVAGSFASSAGCFSPDAKWIAYASSEAGRDEIYVRPYPGPGGQWQVSIGGGLRPHWSNDGREIVYTNLDGDLMFVQVDTQAGFHTAAPRRLFRVGPRMVWAADGDHSRFLVAVRARDAVDPPLKVVTNWATPVSGR
jgi:hypothetical protein